MPPRRNPGRPAAGKKDSNTTPKTYQSTPVPHQITFPARRKVVRTYGRRSLPAQLETTTTPGSENVRRSLRQQTLTQIDYVRSSSSLSGDGGLLLPEGDDGEKEEEVEEEEVDNLMGEEEVEGLQGKGGVRGGIKGRAKGGKQGAKKQAGEEEEMEVEVVKVTAKRKTSERTSKRRKTMGDAPAPSLERKGSSFHTQTLTQFLGASASRSRESGDDGLRVEDEDEVEDLPLPGGMPVKRPATLKKGKGKPVAPDPHTPSSKRIKVRLDEVPSSQPSPDTPWRGYSPLKPTRSPLTQKSTNADAPLPTIETVSKLPRTLVIQDSYSMGSSQGLSSWVAVETPKKEQTPSQKSNREPLTELPVASLDLGIGSTPTGETPSTRKKRMFIEIPDSDDELESIGSTPFRTRSTQQTPLKREEVAEDNFEIAADPGSGSRAGRAAVSATPASLGKSDKENESPAVKVWGDDEETASEGGTPTPTQARKSQAAGRASQVSPNTASQFWTASAEDIGGTGASAALREPLAELAVVEEELTVTEELMVTEERHGTPTPAPRASQFHGSMGGSDGKIRQATPQLEDADETASEAEEESIPTSILRKATSQKTPRADSGKRKSTPEPNTSESSASEAAPGTPTPIVRRVQIELPSSSAEEVYKETPRKQTPRKPHKSSPIYQRQTQARSQFYSQGLESQRVPLEIIRSLGPQTDRSDIVITIHPKIVEDIANGAQDHEFRSYKFPIQVLRCWICTDLPVGELKYMATLGRAQEPGQIDSGTGLGNADFNAGTSGYKFAHKLLQVYQLNNPIPLADMEDNGLGDGPPQRYKYIPPAIVGQLMANLRCPLFADGDDEHEDEEEDDDDHEGGVTISQELEDQIRSDIIHSTQKLSRQGWHEEEEEDIIPASQSPTKQRSATAQKADHDSFARPPVPPRSSQRLRSQHGSQPYPNPQQPRGGGKPSSSASRTPKKYIRPSQATTASDISSVAAPSSSSAVSSPAKSSVPRPPMPESGELSLPDLPDEGESSLLLSRRGFLLHSSSQAAGVLPPDSLLVDEGRMAPPPVEVWDSEEEEEEEEDDDGVY